MLNDKHLQGQSGFTLIEVVFALAIFMIIMLALAQGEITALREQQGNIIRDEATRLMERELARLKSERFTMSDASSALDAANWTTPENITVSSRKGVLNFSRSVRITDIDAEGTKLKRIDVAVGWDRRNGGAALAPTNRNRQTALSTIITASN